MQQYRNYPRLVFLLLLLAQLPAFSQNMNNPYSVYGIGDIDHKAYNRTSGMGGTGLALKSSVYGYLIDNNPASIAGLPRSFYLAHVSVTARASSFSGDPINESNSNNKDMWIKRFALAVKINKFWAASAGFGQFSNINYKLTGSKFIEGTTTEYNTAYEGQGGLNEYYFTNAFSVGRHFSVGLKSSIIAGNITQSETLVDEGLQSVITTTQQDYIGDFRLQGGVLYETALSKRWDLSLGGRYVPKTNFAAERTLSVAENGETVSEDTYMKEDRFHLPTTIAAGIALKHNKKTTFALDYTYEDWSSLKIKERSWQMISSHKISAGIEFPKFKAVGDQLLEYRFFQLGGFFHSSYLQVRNQPIREYGFTAGMGGRIGRGLLYSLSAEAGIRATTRAGLIRETYAGLTLSFSYMDLLLSKGRKYD